MGRIFVLGFICAFSGSPVLTRIICRFAIACSFRAFGRYVIVCFFCTFGRVLTLCRFRAFRRAVTLVGTFGRRLVPGCIRIFGRCFTSGCIGVPGGIIILNCVRAFCRCLAFGALFNLRNFLSLGNQFVAVFIMYMLFLFADHIQQFNFIALVRILMSRILLHPADRNLLRTVTGIVMHMGFCLGQRTNQAAFSVIAALLVYMHTVIRITAYKLACLVTAFIAVYMIFIHTGKNPVRTCQCAPMPCQHAEGSRCDYQRKAKDNCNPPSGVASFL